MNDESLLDPSELFRITIQQSSVAKTMQGEDHRLVMVNPAYCKLVGYDESELLGHDPADFILAPDCIGAVLTEREEATRRGDSVGARIDLYRELIHRDGRRVPVHLEVAVAHCVNKRRILCTSLVDLSSQQRELKAVRERCDLFLREADHRIKNDLQSVANLLELHSVSHPQNMDAYDSAILQLQSVAELRGLQSTLGSEIDPLTVVQSIATRMQNVFGQRVVVTTHGAVNGSESNYVLADSESMPFALVINELMTNACKHAELSRPPFAKVSVGMNQVDVRIYNHGSLASGTGPNSHSDAASGLGLVSALAPEAGLSVSLSDDSGLVTAHVRATPPVLGVVKSSSPTNWVAP